MKKILFLFIFSTFTVAISIAQMEKGRIMTGMASSLNRENFDSDFANLSFSGSKSVSPSGDETEGTKTTGFNLIPSAGYFIIDNLAAGLNLLVSYNKYDLGGSLEQKNTHLHLSAVPFVRYYYPVGKICPFAEVSAGIGTSMQKSVTTHGENKYTWAVTSFGGGAGVALPVGSRVTFDIMAGYSWICYKREVQEDVIVKDMRGSFGLKMGFMVYFEL